MQDTINQLMPVFQKVADKIGQGASFTWEIVLRQQYVNAVEDFIWAIAFGISLFSIYFLIKKMNKWKNEDRYSNWEIGIFFSVVGMIIVSVLTVVFLTEGIAHLINPNYYALDYFINLVKPGSN